MRRQRTAGITLLVAGGLCLAIVKWKRESPVALPQTVQQTTTSPRTPISSEHDGETSQCRHQAQVVDVAHVATVVEQIGTEPNQLLPLLLAIDEHYHYLPPAALRRLRS